MKNLKKVLALVLVVATLLSFATVASAAFTDASDIDHTEAVDVLTAINVINGYTDGSFRPDGNVTRAQMAKMVAYIVAGGEDVGSLYAGANSFSDCTTHWAKGYIAYANKTGIVAGVGGGKFNPDGNVTGTQAAKMMLVALGYDAAVEEYTGTNWAVNTLSDAKEAGLLKGLEGVDMSKAMTREQAAQLMFNALKADMVRYENKGSEVDLGNGVVIRPSASDAEVVTTTQNWGSNISDDGVDKVSANTPYVVQLGEKYFSDLKLNASASADDFGAPASVWTYKSKTVGKYSKDAILTYTDKVKANELADDIEDAGYKVDTTTSDKDVLTVYSNGAPDGMTGTEIKSAIDSKGEFGGKGVELKVYDKNDDDVADTIVLIYTYAGKITDITEDDKDTSKDERALEVETYMGSGKTGSVTLDKDTVGFDTIYASAKEGNVVLVTPKGDTSKATEALTVSAAKSVTGAVTRIKSGDSVTVGGTSYNIAACQRDVNALKLDASKDVVLYLDSYGNAIYTTSPGSTDSADVIYVTSFYKATNDWGSTVNMLQGVLMDGTVVTAEYTGAEKKDESNDNNKAYQYTVENDKYTLTAAEGSTSKVGAVDASSFETITSSAKKVGNYYFGSSVTFVYVNGTRSDLKVSTKDGIQARDFGAGDYAVVSKDSDGNFVINTVFVKGNAVSASDDLIYAAAQISASETKVSDDGKTTLYGFEVYLNGEKTVIYKDNNSAIGAGFYTYSVDDTTGAYSLTSTTTGVADNKTIAQKGVVYVNGTYYVTIADVMDSFDATSAKVVDTTSGGKINSMSKLKNETDDGSKTVAVVFDGEEKTVEYIYVK